MGRPRTGSIFQHDGKFYARVTWTDKKGKRRDKKKQADNLAHAEFLRASMLAGLPTRKVSRTYFPVTLRADLFIYCVQILDGAQQPIKIGIAQDVDSRVRGLLTAIPYEVRVLGFWPGRSSHEKEIHKKFRAHRMAREWFRPAPEVLAYVQEKTTQASVR